MPSDASSRALGPTPSRYPRREFLAAGAVAGGALLGSPAALGALSRTAPARPVTDSGSPPNILVIIVDQLRYPRWFAPPGSSQGWAPNIARIRNGGVSFGRHYTASNDCSPARSALVSGLYTHQTGCMITGKSTLAPAFGTWGTYLSDLGYNTTWYGKWHLTRDDRTWNDVDGPPALEQYGFAGGTYPSPDGRPFQGLDRDPTIAAQFVDWFSASGGDGPWCTAVSFVNPHDITWWYRRTDARPAEASAPRVVQRLPPNFETPAQLASKPPLQRALLFGSEDSFGRVPYGGPRLLPAWLPFLDLYMKLQLAVDEQIGVVLDALESRPEIAANTVVVFTADHGEYGASHGLRGKGAGLYEEALRVPLIVNDPRGLTTAAPEVTRSQITSSVDVAGLLLTLADGSNAWRSDERFAHIAARHDLAAILGDPTAPGRSYALHATDEIATEYAPDRYRISAIHVVGLITDRAKYGIYSRWKADTIEPIASEQERELYDYSTQSGQLELDNVAGHSRLEAGLDETLATAIKHELQAPLPGSLRSAQRTSFDDYFEFQRRLHRAIG
jgi:arylsulfatase A-like enzyme